MLQDILMSVLVEEASLGQKIQNSDDVSVKGRFALDATEKNPAIEGTMAEDIANATNIITRVKNTIDTIVALPDGSVAEDGEIAAAKIGPSGEKYTTLQDAITQQIVDYKGVSVSNTAPAKSSHVDVWVNTTDSESEVIKLPQIDDTTTSKDDTWSSEKINAMIEATKTQVQDADGSVLPVSSIIDDGDASFGKAWSSARTKTEILATLSNISDGEGNTFNIFDLIDDTSEAYNKIWSSIKVRSELNDVIEKIPDTSKIVPGYINDTGVAADKLWSSNKIKTELDSVIAKIPSDSGKFNVFDYIDDTSIGADKIWSSNKVNDELNKVKPSAYINDSTTATDKLWSSNKINNAINSAKATAYIDDNSSATDKLWSASKISTELGNVKTTVSTPASTTSAGLMSAEDKKRLDALVETGNSYVLPEATKSTLGGVIVGSNISVDSNGTISLSKTNITTALGYTPVEDAPEYTLPKATSSILGGVKIGSNISISDGTISLSKANVTGALGYTPPTSDTTYTEATTTKAGLLSAADKTKLNNVAQRLIFANKTVVVGDWKDDTTYTDFPYKASVTCSGVTSDYVAEVIFNVTEVISGIFAPVNETGAGVISIWASEKPSDTTTIPTIICFK